MGLKLETCDICNNFLREAKTRRVTGPRKLKNHRRDQAHFWGEKFENTNDSSFERARHVESNETKINEIG